MKKKLKKKGKKMNTELKTLTINGVEYVQKGCDSKPAEMLEGMKYVIVRTFSAGVFAGYLKSRAGQEVVMLKARRLWYWSGAASLSQLAMEGVANPDSCKFPDVVDRVELLQAIEILDVTEKAKRCIEGVKVWKI